MKWRTTTQPTAIEEAFARAKRERLRGEDALPTFRAIAEWDDCAVSIGVEPDFRSWTIDGEAYARISKIWRIHADGLSSAHQFVAHRPLIRRKVVDGVWVFHVGDMCDAIKEAKSGIKSELQRWLVRKKHNGCRSNRQRHCAAR